MISDLTPGDLASAPVGLRLREESGPHRVRLQLDDLTEPEPRMAAEATVYLDDGVAVMAAVETTPRYRRRGLATFVVRRLEQAALHAGATSGLLIATPAGRALYESLGWRVLAPMRSLRGED